MTRRHRPFWHVAVLAALLALPSPAGAEEFHYSMAARIRPLLVFWIGRSGVGSAVVTREQSDGGERYALLIGSDPDRAPRRINRWGYIEEERRGGGARLIGLMTQSDEESIEQADATLRAQASGRHPFKVIQATVEGDRASSRVTTIAAPEDLTLRQLASALDLARREDTSGTLRTLRLPAGARPGFLVALSDAMRTMTTDPIRYVYYGRLYELRQLRVRRLASVRIGQAAIGSGASADFVIKSLYDGEETRFSMTYGTAGRFAAVPLSVTYQPRWWLQVELTIDDAGRAPALIAGAER